MTIVLLAGATWIIASLAFAAERRTPADASAFTREVLPILERHCVECHSDDTSEAGLRLISRETLLHGSASGYIVVPGSSTASLVTRLVSAGGKPHMPPEGQLTDAEIDTLKRWIDQLPGDALPSRGGNLDRNHWAYQRLVRPALPAVNNESWVRTAIDRFVLAKLEAAGISPAPQADRAQLLRRVSFDLVGLPPTPEQVQAFLADDAPDAYERVVNRLLDSPAYGERWGRHWLDLARYADSGGFHDDLDRPHAWRYRDYVIRSFNDDKPYAQFVAEQLAGDELAPQDADAWAATGFCRNGPSNDNNVGPQKEQYRLDQLDDIVSTASAVFLGQTIGCARCHDHKYDPITQADYYRFLAIFDNTRKVEVPLNEEGRPLAAEPAADKSKHKAALMGLTNSDATPRKTHLLYRGDANNRGPVVEPGVPVALASHALELPTSDGMITTGQRLALTKWIAAPENPLAWRVVVNRIWQHHFGQGLVATPSNFGRTGGLPTHPELLDWLAAEMISQEGRWKPLHRLIVTSATYCQASHTSEAALAADPQNRLLGRMPLVRLEAEAIRDAILSVAGTLNAEMGGPGVKPRIPAEMLVASQRNKWPKVDREGPEHWRRSVYIYVKRQLPFPLLELHDSPNTSQTCQGREASVVPTQALVLMNDRFTQDQAARFADRVRYEAEADWSSQAERALWLALCRPPNATRVREAVEFLNQRRAVYLQSGMDEATSARQATIDLCHVLINCNEFVYID